MKRHDYLVDLKNIHVLISVIVSLQVNDQDGTALNVSQGTFFPSNQS